jgi:hypothetical protein
MAAEDRTQSVPPEVIEFLSEQKTLTLATVSGSGIPRATPLAYVNQGTDVFFWIRSNTITAHHLEENPVAAYAISEYSPDPRNTRGIQAIGQCGVVLDGMEIARVAMLFGDKFPEMTAGSSTMGLSFYRLVATDLQYIDNTRGGAKSAEEFGLNYRKEVVYNVLGDLPQGEGGAVTGSMRTVQADPGSVIVRQGAPAEKFFIIEEGEVELVREDDGKTETVATLGPGQFFGDVAILREGARGATARAVGQTKLLAMERDQFRDLVASSIGAAADFDRVIQGRLS